MYSCGTGWRTARAPILWDRMWGDSACLVAGSTRAARVHIITPGLHEIDAHVEQRTVAEVGPPGRRTSMSKRSLRGLTRRLRNLESPATETGAKAMHDSPAAIAVAQPELAHPIVQRLSAHGARLSIRRSETKNEGRVTVGPDPVHDRERLRRKRHVVLRGASAPLSAPTPGANRTPELLSEPAPEATLMRSPVLPSSTQRRTEAGEPQRGAQGPRTRLGKAHPRDRRPSSWAR